jgi:hypothetical protein
MIICRWKRNLASACLGRCEDTYLGYGRSATWFSSTWSPRQHIRECWSQHGMCKIAAISLIMFLFRLPVVWGLFLNALPFNRLHRWSYVWILGDQSSFDIIPFPKKLSKSLDARLDVWHVAPILLKIIELSGPDRSTDSQILRNCWGRHRCWRSCRRKWDKLYSTAHLLFMWLEGLFVNGMRIRIS